jgi:UDP-glucose 4-epimerase
MSNPQLARVLILGNSGFIGSHVERRIKKNLPTIEVIGYSAPSLDLSKEKEAAAIIPFLDMATAIVMLAGVKRQLGDTLQTFDQNIQITRNVCQLLEHHPVKRFIFFSSAAVYGEEIHNINITEDTSVHPTSYYGVAKYTSECLLEKAVRSNPQSTLLILRPPLIYGPGDTGSGYGPSGFVDAAARNETITIWGDGTEHREFIFVEDVAEIVSRLTPGESSEIVNIASGTSYTYLDALAFISKALGKDVQTISRPRSKTKVDHGFSNARLTKLLPDFVFTPLEEGIRRLVAARR